MKIISGGQTGVDRAGIDVAIKLGLDYGGALPKGRLTEEGPLDSKYDHMTELETVNYPARTDRNVKDADATLIFTMGQIGRGTALTIRKTKKYRIPYLHIDLDEKSEQEAVQEARNWIKEVCPEVLNIAGTRESKAPGIYEKVYNILVEVLK